MADIDLKAATPDTSLPTTGFLFGADSQAASAPSVYSTQTVATTLLGSTSLTGATITTSQPVLDLAQTWNNSGVTFTGMKLNVTDTASASASLLMDLQVGGTSRFNVNKTGAVNALADGSAAAPSLRLGATEVHGFYRTGGSSIGLSIAGALTFQFSSITQGVGFRLLANDLGIGFGATADLFLTRRAAANLRLGAADAAAPVAQTLSVQSVVAGTSNTAGANLTITGSQGTGTGAGGSIIFQVAPAGSSGTAQNALADALTITSNRFVTFNVSGFRFGGATNQLVIYDSSNSDTFGIGQYNVGVTVTNAGSYRFSSTTSPGGTADLFLSRDAANTLALRNGTNAQTFNIYNTFTSSTNFERFRIVAQSADTVLIGTQKGSGGGTARALALQTDGTTRLTIETNGDLTIADAENIILGTTTGTKIGTATTQKIGFFNAAPVVQPTAVADATDNATAITQLNALLSRMRDLGLIAT